MAFVVERECEQKQGKRMKASLLAISGELKQTGGMRMMDRNERDRLLEELEHRLGRMRGRTPGQIGEMWEFALRCNRAFENGASEGHFSGPINDAIPYIPTEVQQCGGGIDESMGLLDIGCFGGYGLFDFAMARWRASLGVPALVGLDVDPISVGEGKELTSLLGKAAPVFVCANAECLPFADGTFDWVVGRLLLPYVPVNRVLSEIVRVMAPGGHVLFQTHAPRYYLRRMGQNLLHPVRLAYYCRALLGVLPLCTSVSGRRSPIAGEYAMTDGVVRKCLADAGLQVVWSCCRRLKPLYLCKRFRG